MICLFIDYLFFGGLVSCPWIICFVSWIHCFFFQWRICCAIDYLFWRKYLFFIYCLFFHGYCFPMEYLPFQLNIFFLWIIIVFHGLFVFHELPVFFRWISCFLRHWLLLLFGDYYFFMDYLFFFSLSYCSPIAYLFFHWLFVFFLWIISFALIIVFFCHELIFRGVFVRSLIICFFSLIICFFADY